MRLELMYPGETMILMYVNKLQVTISQAILNKTARPHLKKNWEPC